MSGAALIWSPFADAENAKRVAKALLDERLIACANILPGVTSLFRWGGAISESTEVGVLFKTSDILLASAARRIAELHVYDTPVVIGWRADFATGATLAWLQDELGTNDRKQEGE